MSCFALRPSEGLPKGGLDLRFAHANCLWSSGDEVRGAPNKLGLELPDNSTEPSSQAISCWCITDSFPESVCNPWWSLSRPINTSNGDCPATTRWRTRERDECRMVADTPDQAESRERPRARRALITARPPRVRILRRKPWVLLRLRVLGWKVRFMHGHFGVEG